MIVPSAVASAIEAIERRILSTKPPVIGQPNETGKKQGKPHQHPLPMRRATHRGIDPDPDHHAKGDQ
jgi:hypothetical protein